MRHELAALSPQLETIAELRELYRAAEARAARMRLLSMAGRELAEADATSIEPVLRRCAERVAFFLGRQSAAVTFGPAGDGIAITAPGPRREPLAWLSVAGITCADDIADQEDRDAFAMHLELMGATIDRIRREEERAALLAALREREQRLELLVGSIFSAQEEERGRVSRDLHDGVAQTATALARMLEGARAGQEEDLPAAERARLAAVARQLVAELRGVIGGLRPTLLDDLGLEAALRALAEGLEADGFTVRLAIAQLPARMPPPVETAFFRVAQEAFTNIRKHAGGSCAVTVELRQSPLDATLLLRICDSGSGVGENVCPQDTRQGLHVGVDGMRERMAAIGGSLDWRAGKAGGVTVTARLPARA
ncbi:sensor histidine kinase [Porphyrobacter sp. GA68]|uniref:sensor histidine kinase n=1 Tax=Porphyrobacter sp. GA68 TaxID=2883480 RepID=UPI001D1964CB|nr:sensor histidine kinase [Porphyrobacter sp. GA68]